MNMNFVIIEMAWGNNIYLSNQSAAINFSYLLCSNMAEIKVEIIMIDCPCVNKQVICGSNGNLRYPSIYFCIFRFHCV